jgi:2'-5' RNA ligase
MNKNGLTSEFGICLVPDASTVESIYDIRLLLPSSPYRDDPPHLTLLRAINCPREMSDSDLLQDVESRLNLTDALPLQATITKIGNGFSPLHKNISALFFQASPAMSSYRKQAIKSLKAGGYKLGILGSKLFIPHISVRLGVPFTQQARVAAEQHFKKGDVTNFSKWVLFRILYDNNSRLIREITLDR